MIDLVSISFVKSLGLSSCDKKKHQHKEPMVEGIGRMKAKTYGFFHLRLCITDQWNQSIRFIRPFLAVDRSSRNSQVLLGRPALKDLRVNIDNVNDCWEIKNLPRVKPVSPSRFDREVLDGTQVFEVRVAYRPVSKDCDSKGVEKNERKDLPVPAEGREDDRDGKGNHHKKRCDIIRNGSGEPLGSYRKKNKNKGSGERRRLRKNCPKGQPRNGERHQEFGGRAVEDRKKSGRIGGKLTEGARSGEIGIGACLGTGTGLDFRGDFSEFAGRPREAGARSQTGPSLGAGVECRVSEIVPHPDARRDPELGNTRRNPELGNASPTTRLDPKLGNARRDTRRQPEWGNFGTAAQCQARNGNSGARARPQAGIGNSGDWARCVPGKIIFRDCQGREVPEYLYRKFPKFFSHEEANKLAPHRDTDHAIDLKPRTEPPFMRTYNLSPAELKALEEYIEKVLARG